MAVIFWIQGPGRTIETATVFLKIALSQNKIIYSSEFGYAAADSINEEFGDDWEWFSMSPEMVEAALEMEERR